MEITEKVWLCEDCLFPAVYGDFSGLDYYYTPESAAIRMSEIEAGLERLSVSGVLIIGEDENEFSTSPCECCGCNLAGKRHEFFILGGLP